MTAKNDSWDVDASRILSPKELHDVLHALHRKRRSVTTRMKTAIVRLSCCCGLRVSEIAGLRIDDIRLSGHHPHVRVRREIAKGRKARKVPLNWDAGTLADLTAWQAERIRQGAAKTDPLICSQRSDQFGKPLQRESTNGVRNQKPVRMSTRSAVADALFVGGQKIFGICLPCGLGVVGCVPRMGRGRPWYKKGSESAAADERVFLFDRC